MIKFTAKGDYSKTRKFLKKLSSNDFYRNIEAMAQEGVDALAEATPKDTGLTSESWTYSIARTSTSLTITWTNSNFNKGVPIALLIQYGHGTRNGGYVSGVDYINPAMRPIFEKIEEYVLKEVGSE